MDIEKWNHESFERLLYCVFNIFASFCYNVIQQEIMVILNLYMYTYNKYRVTRTKKSNKSSIYQALKPHYNNIL